MPTDPPPGLGGGAGYRIPEEEWIIRQLRTCYLPLLFLAVAAPGFPAVITGWNLTVSGNTNLPTFDLRNDSSAGIDIVAFEMTIGNTAKNFDFATVLSVNPLVRVSALG